MKQSSLVGFGLACFVVGMFVQAGFAQGRKPTFTPDLLKANDGKEFWHWVNAGGSYFGVRPQ